MNNNQLVEREEIIKNIRDYVLIDDQLKIINEKVKSLREKKQKLSDYICNYSERKNINKKIIISDGELKISERKEYSPLSYTYIEESLTKIISDKNKVNYIINYLKENRSVKTISEIKRVKN
tara:strand:+ start:205 stop:570 length:366 start_codon:yes stop_codon:yes gene_type:complete